MRSPRVRNALNEVINAKGRIMNIALKHLPHITFIEALPNFTWSRYDYEIKREYLELSRKQAIVLQQIKDGVPCFYMKKCQAEVNYHPIFKCIWDEAVKKYVCHRRIYHFENHQKVYEWKRGGEISLDLIEDMLNRYTYLASLTPMTNNYNYNMD